MQEENNHKIWELIAGKIHDELSSEETAELGDALEQAQNKKFLEEAEKIHEKLKHLTYQGGNVSERSWGRVSSFMRRKKIRILLSITRYAAIVVFALVAGYLLNREEPAEPAPTRISEISVPLGQMSQITLFDGTEVWLNSGTTLRYGSDFGESTRDVSLNGEAFFKVRQSTVPFRVKLKDSEVEVTGTSFNVVSFGEENYSEVTLVEGKVKINTPGGREIAELQPSEQITLLRDSHEGILKMVDTGFYMSWTAGKIVFEDERLADVTRKLERWYNVEISFSDNSIGEYRFSGTILKNKPLDQIVKAFALLLPVRIEYSNNLNMKDTVLILKK
jgi:transmembrane sensor